MSTGKSTNKLFYGTTLDDFDISNL